MKLNNAINIVKYHQLWRRGLENDMRHSPKVIGDALDVVINAANEFMNVDYSDSSDDYLIKYVQERIEYHKARTEHENKDFSAKHKRLMRNYLKIHDVLKKELNDDRKDISE